MMPTSDYVGIATLITAGGAAIVSIIVALRQGGIKKTVDQTHQQVVTKNGATLAEIVEANDLTGVADHAPPPTP